jgi:pyrroline-5-carboxylate reductase
MKIGFIGAGKMGGAILKGLINSGFAKKEDIAVAELNPEIAEHISSEFGIKTHNDSNLLVKESDVIIICTKPFVIKEVLEGIKTSVDKSKLIISIAAGISTATIEGILGNIPVVRVMPNTPAFLGHGMSGLSKGSYASDEQLNFACEIFSKVGKAITIEENLIDALTGISGSGPAFFYLVIEALAKGGEELGLDPAVALELSAQTAIGSAHMIMETGKTPEVLRKEVTTPGGCTAVGLDVLAEAKVFDAFVETVKATAKKAEELGK